MDIHSVIASISYAIGIVVAVIIAVTLVKSTSVKNTIQVQSENIRALQDSQVIHEANLKTFASENEALKARLSVVETIPLRDILRHLGQISRAQNKILLAQNKIMKGSK